jgi:hypothetical protein
VLLTSAENECTSAGAEKLYSSSSGMLSLWKFVSIEDAVCLVRSLVEQYICMRVVVGEKVKVARTAYTAFGAVLIRMPPPTIIDHLVDSSEYPITSVGHLAIANGCIRGIF